MRGLASAALLAAAFIALACSAGASQDVERVVVTGSRISYDRVPHISLDKRADYIITEIRVTCDTRDPTQRREELKTTLRDMIKAAAKTETISLAVGEGFLGPLRENMFDDIVVGKQRADTSEAAIILKSKLSATDTFDSAAGRIKAFIASAPRAGRTEILRDEENRWDLTLVNPEQYRDELIKRIVADARHTAELVGPGHGVSIDGLQSPVAWYQRGPLDLGLYIPYTLVVAPIGK